MATTQRTVRVSRFRDDPTDLEAVYFRWIQPGAAAPAITDRAERIFRHHLELAALRRPGVALARLYRFADGSELGPAIQIVNDDMPMLVDTVTSALRRLGVVIAEIVHPVFDVARDSAGRLQGVWPREAEGWPDVRGRTTAESWIHVQLSPATDNRSLDGLERVLLPQLDELRRVNEDSSAMLDRMTTVADRLDRAARSVGDAVPGEYTRLLRWLADGHFSVLGYGYYPLTRTGSDAEPVQLTGTGLGVLRDGVGVPGVRAAGPALQLTAGSVASAVPGASDLCFVSVEDSGAEPGSSVAGTHVFAGTFTVTGSHEDILDIPVISRRVHQVIEWAGLDLTSFSGRAMLEMLQTFPRVELFATDARRLFETVSAVMNVGLRRQVRLFLRRDDRSSAVHCLVYLPRDRYSTDVRLRMQEVLAAEFGGEHLAHSARVTESDVAAIYFTVHRDHPAPAVDLSETNRDRIQELLVATTRTWADRLAAEAASSPELDVAVAQRCADAFPPSYQQEYEPARALRDLRRLTSLADGSVASHLYRDPESPSGDWRFTLYVAGSEVSLSRVLPLLHSLGMEVLDERPYRIELPGHTSRWIYDFGLRAPATLLRAATDPDLELELTRSGLSEESAEGTVRQRFCDAVAAMWLGRAEVDRLNELVLRAGLDWRRVAVLRAYAKYLQQAGFAYTFANITRVLLSHPAAAGWFTELFYARFDPDGVPETTSARAEAVSAHLRDAIDAVVSLDTDRILRAILGLITSTLRTNYFRRDADGRPRPQLSFKLDPRKIAELPEPRPR
ncbi:NAD-glutamate dehydrogenase domain-containing protein, partial [Nocardia vaccinii]|uniref:NAD-glutamate dehydrogenase domain-containing protein n=1 Tax=Nocardia vaccinii TaxID=1822 RepID=UPI00157BDA28